MSTSITFGQWLKATREAHGYSQGELGDLVEMKRTYVNAIENQPKWPKPETRARFHDVFGTSDEDLVRAGAATRTEYPRASGTPRVVYEPLVRRGDRAADGASASLGDMPAWLAERHQQLHAHLRNLNEPQFESLLDTARIWARAAEARQSADPDHTRPVSPPSWPEKTAPPPRGNGSSAPETDQHSAPCT